MTPRLAGAAGHVSRDHFLNCGVQPLAWPQLRRRRRHRYAPIVAHGGENGALASRSAPLLGLAVLIAASAAAVLNPRA